MGTYAYCTIISVNKLIENNVLEIFEKYYNQMWKKGNDEIIGHYYFQIYCDHIDGDDFGVVELDYWSKEKLTKEEDEKYTSLITECILFDEDYHI